MTLHAKRIITAFILGPLLFISIFFFPDSFIILAMLTALTGIKEYNNMIRPEPDKSMVLANYLLTVALFLSLWTDSKLYLSLLPFFVILPMIISIIKYPDSGLITEQALKIITGPFYICLPLLFLVLILGIPQGRLWIFFILAVVFAGDTVSFYVGRFLGRHKLTPLSPGKTWEGSIGGILANIVTACIFALPAFPSLSVISIVLLAIAVGVSAQLGDLAESMLKRNSDIKDSGEILPGHGGILDRIDGLLFGAPVLFFYLCLQI